MDRIFSPVAFEAVVLLHTQAEQRAHGGPHHPGIKRIGGRPDDSDILDAKAQQRALDGAQIAFIHGMMQHHMGAI